MTDRGAAIRGLIADQPSHGDDAADYLRRVCTGVVLALAASGAGVSLLTEDGVSGVAVASDPTAWRIEELQFLFGEGPCVDAFAARSPVLVPDLGNHAMTRWPIYAPAAHEGGVRGVFAFPLQIGVARLGVLDVFRTRVGALTADQFADAVTFADIAVEALLDQQQNADGAADGLGEAIEYRAVLFQAQGMVMAQLGTNLADAMARMRAYAYAHNRRLGDVARDVVARRLLFDEDRT